MVNDIMYVRISDPKEIKRNVLESAINILQIQKGIDKLKLQKHSTEHSTLLLKRTTLELLRETRSIKLSQIEKPVIKRNIEKSKKSKKHKTLTSKPEVKNIYKDKFERNISDLRSKIQSL